MINKIIDIFLNRKIKKIRKTLPAIDWKYLYKEIEKFVIKNDIYLETRHNGFIPLNSSQANDPKTEIVALIVTPAKDGLPAWETEEPAKNILEIIRNNTNRECNLLLSRDYNSFVGYYVQIK